MLILYEVTQSFSDNNIPGDHHVQLEYYLQRVVVLATILLMIINSSVCSLIMTQVTKATTAGCKQEHRLDKNLKSLVREKTHTQSCKEARGWGIIHN